MSENLQNPTGQIKSYVNISNIIYRYTLKTLIFNFMLILGILMDFVAPLVYQFFYVIYKLYKYCAHSSIPLPFFKELLRSEIQLPCSEFGLWNLDYGIWILDYLFPQSFYVIYSFYKLYNYCAYSSIPLPLFKELPLIFIATLTASIFSDCISSPQRAFFLQPFSFHLDNIHWVLKLTSKENFPFTAVAFAIVIL